MDSVGSFDRIMQALYQAMLDDAHWPAAAALIDEACGVRGSALVVGRGCAQGEGQIYLARFCTGGQRDEELERWYFDLYYPRDERVPRLTRLPHARLAAMQDLYTPAEQKTSPAYNEALPQAGYQNGLNVRLDGQEGTHIVWTLADSTEAGGWGTTQTAMIERLLPHLRRYVEVRQTLVDAQALGAGLADLLDNRRIGVIHLDRSGGIVAANDRAMDGLRRGDALLVRNGALHTWLPADDDRLQKLVGRALPGFGGEAPVGGSMALRRAHGRPHLMLHVSPLGSGQADYGDRRVAAWVLVADPAQRPRVDAAWVSEALGLTAQEGRVAAMLAEGRSVREIALASGHRQSYVRWLLRQAYRKHGLPGHVALVRLVLAADILRPRFA